MKIPYQKTISAWKAVEVENYTNEWRWILLEEEIKELEIAAENFLSTGKELSKITASNFVLNNLKKKIHALRTFLIHGKGFKLISGLPIERYSEIEIYTIFLGIGAHLGKMRSQNANGHLLGHVRNLGFSSKDPNVRIYQTKERQTFHSDSCDVVGLLCVNPAKSGGKSLLVSAVTVFNEIKTQRPELLPLLFDPIATDRRGEVPMGMLPYLLIPVYSYFKDKLTVFYQRQYIESAQRFPDAPRLNEKHYKALDFFDLLCNDSSLHLSMMLEKGDMQFVYNHAMLHDRTAFIDWEDASRKRHLVRLWLSIPGDRELPSVFASRFGSIEIGNRGGIEVKSIDLKIPFLKDLKIVLKKSKSDIK